MLNPRANTLLTLALPPVAALLGPGANLMLGTDKGMLNRPQLLQALDFTGKLARSPAGHATLPAPAALLRMASRNAYAVLGDDFPGMLE